MASQPRRAVGSAGTAENAAWDGVRHRHGPTRQSPPGRRARRPGVHGGAPPARRRPRDRGRPRPGRRDQRHPGRPLVFFRGGYASLALDANGWPSARSVPATGSQTGATPASPLSRLAGSRRAGPRRCSWMRSSRRSRGSRCRAAGSRSGWHGVRYPTVWPGSNPSALAPRPH